VFFVKGSHGPELFGNQAAVGFPYNGTWYPSMEHFFQAHKYAPHNMERHAQIVNAQNGKTALSMGRDHSYPIRSDWEQIKVDVMREGLRAKFRHNILAATALCEIDPSQLTDSLHGSDDSFWGFGTNPDGSSKTNMLGSLMYQIRQELLNCTPSVPSVGTTGVTNALILGYLLVRVKITSSTSGLSALPPNQVHHGSYIDRFGSMSRGELGQVEHGYLGIILKNIFSIVTEGTNTRIAMAKTMQDGPTFSLCVDYANDTDHCDTLCLQCIPTVVTGKVKRTHFEQCCLEGLSICKTCIMKDKMYIYAAGGFRSSGSIFPVYAGSHMGPSVAISIGADSTAQSNGGLTVGPSHIGTQLQLAPGLIIGNNGEIKSEFADMKLMLAKDAHGIDGAIKIHSKNPSEQFMLQPKLDGIRLLIHLDPADQNNLIALTRQGNSHDIAREFVSEIVPVLQRMNADLGRRMALDGELYIHGMPTGLIEWVSGKYNGHGPYAGTILPTQLNKITGAASSYGNNSAAEQKNKALVDILEFHVFGAVSINDNTPAIDRWRLLEKYLPRDRLGQSHFRLKNNVVAASICQGSTSTYQGSAMPMGPAEIPLNNAGVSQVVNSMETWEKIGPRVYMVDAAIVMGVSTFVTCMNQIVSLGYEGMMIYTVDAPYTKGLRNKALLKIKHTEKEWFQISGVAPEANGQPFANIKYIHDGNEYIASGFFNDAMKRFLYANGNAVVGMMAYIRFQKITTGANSGGALRDPKVIYISREKDGIPVNIDNL
jgi:ribA/ribD-fused uncharacterized protein